MGSTIRPANNRLASMEAPSMGDGHAHTGLTWRGTRPAEPTHRWLPV